MNEPSNPKRAQMREAESLIHSQSSTVGMSATSDYIELRRAEIVEEMLHCSSMTEVAEKQGRVRELDMLLRVIRTGPYEIK